MTEAEWAACRDPRQLLDYHRMKTDPRRLRLLAAACARAVGDTSPLVARVLDVVERYADGTADRAEFLAARTAARGNPDVRLPLRHLTDDAMEALTLAITLVRDRTDPVVECDLIRCVFGNPYRRTGTDPAWRTEAAVGLARGVYESRDFGPMPVLADALEDAGCTAADVLGHCRAGGPHARGCWVVDGLLGRG